MNCRGWPDLRVQENHEGIIMKRILAFGLLIFSIAIFSQAVSAQEFYAVFQWIDRDDR